MSNVPLKGFKTWYLAAGEKKWATNSLVHPTQEQAANAGRELSSRWKLVLEWAVIPYEETPFYLDHDYVNKFAVERETVR